MPAAQRITLKIYEKSVDQQRKTYIGRWLTVDANGGWLLHMLSAAP
jgi:hypothetical protein